MSPLYTLRVLSGLWLAVLFVFSFSGRASAQPCPEFCRCNGTVGLVVICEQQQLQQVPPLEFNAMGNATTLTLGNNNIRVLPRYGFFHLVALRSLFVYYNEIDDVHTNAFRGLRQLQLLSLFGNKIASLPTAVFEELPNLLSLYLHENALKGEKISKELLRPLRNLRTLTLNKNNISSLTPGTFSPLRQLRVLELQSNTIRRLDRNSFVGLPLLRRLDLALNNMEEIVDGAFTNLTSLELLDLSFNSLSSVSRLLFVDLINLRDLRLSDNRITTIDDGSFFRLSRLRRLILHSNGLSEIRPGMFSGLRILEVLWLHRNRIETIREDTFRDLGQLVELYLYYNRLTTLAYCQFKGADQLSILVIQFNQISCVADSAFCCLPQLSRLYLDSNDIQHITPRTFSCLTRVTRLTLSGNRIRFVADGAFNSMTALEQIWWDYSPANPKPSADAISNNMECNCNAIYFRGFLTQSPGVVNTVRCTSPPHLYNKKLRTILQDSLNCTGDATVSINIDDYKSPSAYRLRPTSASPAAVDTIFVALGEDLHLVSRASPRGVTFWTRAGKALPARDCGMVTPQGNLHLSSMSDFFQGLYTLVVQSGSGATARSVFVSLGEPAKVSIAPRDVEMAYPGENVMFVCVVSGNPKPITYWMKNGVRLNITTFTPSSSFATKTGRYILSEHALHILRTQYVDAGIYRCVTRNGLGRGDSREAELFFRRATPCMPSCRNNGTCRTTLLHTCDCTRNFVGDVCEKPKPHGRLPDCDSLTGSGCFSGSGGSGGSGDPLAVTDPIDNTGPAVPRNRTSLDSLEPIGPVENSNRPGGIEQP